MATTMPKLMRAPADPPDQVREEWSMTRSPDAAPEPGKAPTNVSHLLNALPSQPLETMRFDAPYNEHYPAAWSPDGGRLVYTADGLELEGGDHVRRHADR
jgi:hypothetical protein